MQWTVAILTLIPGLAMAAQPRNSDEFVLRLITSQTAERIALTGMRWPVQLSADALTRRIRLRPSKGDSAVALADQITKHAGVLCPRVDVKDGAVEMICRSRRIEAKITAEGKAKYLDIDELRGLPWRAGPDAAPSYFFDPGKVGMGETCPGGNDAAKGECALKEGRILEAAGHFRAALESNNRQMACVRLGDLASGIGDSSTASGWYHRTGSFGYFGRIAEARLCELDGKCLNTTADVLRAYDSAGLPEPLRAESLIRAARAEAYSDRLPSAIHIIHKQVKEHGIESICREGGDLLCRRILLEAMRTVIAADLALAVKEARRNVNEEPAPAVHASPLTPAERDYLSDLLEVYLELPSWEKGPLAIDLVQAAASLAVRMGAPGFAGNLLASLAPEVPPGLLADHLLQASEVFVGGENWPQARIVSEYAESRLGRKALKGSRWTEVFRILAMRAEEDEVSPRVREAIESEMAATLVELKRAHGVLDQAEGVLGSARAARSSRSQVNSKPTAQNMEKRQ